MTSDEDGEMLRVGATISGTRKNDEEMSGAPLLELAMLEASIAGLPGQSAMQSRLEFESLWLTLGKMRRGSLIPKYDRSDKEKRVWSWPGRSAERQCGGHAGSREVGPSGMRVGCTPGPGPHWATAPMSFHSQTFPLPTKREQKGRTRILGGMHTFSDFATAAISEY